jgi:uncharacterized protein YjiS (DUF1127 family)
MFSAVPTARSTAELDGRLLDDIGVTRQQAIAEASEPFWK